MNEHTPTPWTWTNERNPVFESDDRIIAHRYNLHNELVEALEEMHTLAIRGLGPFEDIAALLAKAKGEKK